MARGRPAFINHEIICWARKLDNVSVEEAAKSAGVPIEKLLRWENGEILPTINQAKKLANKYRVPFVNFYLPNIPTKFKRPKSKDYRTISADGFEPTMSREMLFLLRDIMNRRDIVLDLNEDLEEQTIKFTEKIEIEQENFKSSAVLIRELLNLTIEKQTAFKDSYSAYNYYTEILNKLGILVFQSAKIDTNEMRGMSVYKDILPIIVVNRKDTVNARIFTLFHELVHLLTRTPGICDDMFVDQSNFFNIEAYCNNIAAQTLVPEENLVTNIYYERLREYGWDEQYITSLANKFSVSREVIIGRLFNINFIKRDFYIDKLKQYRNEYYDYLDRKKAKEKKSDGYLPYKDNIISQLGKPYVRKVIEAYNQDIITPRMASNYLAGIKIHHFNTIERWCF